MPSRLHGAGGQAEPEAKLSTSIAGNGAREQTREWPWHDERIGSCMGAHKLQSGWASSGPDGAAVGSCPVQGVRLRGLC